MCIQVFNELLRLVIWWLASRETHNTYTSQTDSLITKLSVAYIVNSVLIPMALSVPPSSLSLEGVKENSGAGEWWSAEGISYTGTMLVLCNSFFPSLIILSGLDRMPLVWIEASGATTQKEMDQAYAAPPFDFAEAYGAFIKTFALGLLFAPFVPLTLPITLCSFAAQYWHSRWLLAGVSKIPPQMSLGHLDKVRHILRGVLLAYTLVVVWVYQEACTGLSDCGAVEDQCACSSSTFLFLIAFVASWCVWTFIPVRVLWCNYVLCRKSCGGNRILPANVETSASQPFIEDPEARRVRELIDGPGSWSYLLPSPNVSGANPSKSRSAPLVHTRESGLSITDLDLDANPAIQYVS